MFLTRAVVEICHALEMESEERAARIAPLAQTRQRTKHRWAGNLVAELCEVRFDLPQEIKTSSRAEAAAGQRR